MRRSWDVHNCMMSVIQFICPPKFQNILEQQTLKLMMLMYACARVIIIICPYIHII